MKFGNSNLLANFVTIPCRRIRIICGSVTPAMLIDHHMLGYSYESDPPQVAPIVRAAPSISKNERSIKHVIPVFPLMSEIKLISRRRPQRKIIRMKRKRLPKRVVSKKGKRRINRRAY